MQLGPAQFDLGDMLAKLAGAGVISWAAVAAFVKWALPAKLEAIITAATERKFAELEAELDARPDASDVERLEGEVRELRKTLGDVYTLAQDMRTDVAHIRGLMGIEQRRRVGRGD